MVIGGINNGNGSWIVPAGNLEPSTACARWFVGKVQPIRIDAMGDRPAMMAMPVAMSR